jgi:hypothetical protein
VKQPTIEKTTPSAMRPLPKVTLAELIIAFAAIPVIADDETFKLGNRSSSATFHLSGARKLFTEGFPIFAGQDSGELSTFNFQGPDSALYIAGVEGKKQFMLRVSRGHIFINGEQRKDHLGFSIDAVENDKGKTYTRISAID